MQDTNSKTPVIERSLTTAELNDKIYRFMQERNRQDAEARQSFSSNTLTRVQPIIERPLTSDELNDRMYRFMQERNRQDAEAQQRFSSNTLTRVQPIIERPLSNDELSDKMYKFMQERNRQDAEAQQRLGGKNNFFKSDKNNHAYQPTDLNIKSKMSLDEEMVNLIQNQKNYDSNINTHEKDLAAQMKRNGR